MKIFCRSCDTEVFENNIDHYLVADERLDKMTIVEAFCAKCGEVYTIELKGSVKNLLKMKKELKDKYRL